MHCEQIEALLGKLVFDELDEAAKRAALDHLAGCPACKELFLDMRSAALLVKEGLEAGPAPVLSAERKQILNRQGAKVDKVTSGKGPRIPRAAAPKSKPRAARPSAVLTYAPMRIFMSVAAVLLICLVLGALLMPALMGAKESAKRASEQSRAREEMMMSRVEAQESKRLYASSDRETTTTHPDSGGLNQWRKDGPMDWASATPPPASSPSVPGKAVLGRGEGESFGWKQKATEAMREQSKSMAGDTFAYAQAPASAAPARPRSLTLNGPAETPRVAMTPAAPPPVAAPKPQSPSDPVVVAQGGPVNALRARGYTGLAGEERAGQDQFFQNNKSQEESDHNETMNDSDFQMAKGDARDFLADKPFKGPAATESLGVGGAVPFGSRSGSSRQMAVAGGPPAPEGKPSEKALTAETKMKSGGRPDAGAATGKPATVDSKLGAAKAWNMPAEPKSPTRPSSGPGANRELAEKSRREAESRAKPAAEAAVRRDAESRERSKEESSLAAKVDALKKVEDGRRNENAESQIRAGAMILAVPEPAAPAPDGYARAAGRELAQHERLAKALDQLKSDEKDARPAVTTGAVVEDALPPFVRLKTEESGGEKEKATFFLDEPRTPGIDGKKEEGVEGRKVLQEARKELQQQAQQAAEPDESLPSASFFKAGPVNPWVLANRDRFSTFALAVDTASYTLARRFFQKGFLPPAASVRMEEFVNAFDYNYPGQTADVFAIHAEGAPSPFRPNLTLLKVGVKGKVLGREGRKPAHLVFVIDGSGSMARPDRLPLIQYALRGLAGQLGPADRVSVVVFGTEARLAAEAVPAARRAEILAALDSVQPAGPTNLLLGLQLGYEVAQRQFRAGEINRVILCTDGVANIGSNDADEMLGNIKAYRDQGVTFTAAGFGTGSYNDALLARLAAQGDGRYVFIDSAAEARRVFVEEMAATLQSIAVDAKIQVEFDPARVRRYRLIGYEARAIRDEDFRNDAIEAAEVGSGQSATALYELELADDGAWMTANDVRAGTSPAPRAGCPVPDASLGTVFVRYRNADTGKIEEISKRVEAGAIRRRTVDDSPRFFLAAAVAELAELLRESEYAQGGNFARAAEVLAGVARQLPLDKKVREVADLAARAKGLTRAQ
jgi:Ca-activated chloride channel family protein